MERRVILAFLLMLIVLVLPGILFPPKKTPAKRPVGQDSTGTPSPTPAPATPETAVVPPPSSFLCRSGAFVAPSETIWVATPHARFGFSPAGAQLVSAELLDYKSFAPSDSERPVQLVPAGLPLLAHCLVVGPDTISLADWRFTPNVPALRVQRDSVPLTLTAERGGARVALTYVFFVDEYRFQVRGHEVDVMLGNGHIRGLGDRAGGALNTFEITQHLGRSGQARQHGWTEPRGCHRDARRQGLRGIRAQPKVERSTGDRPWDRLEHGRELRFSEG